MCVFLTLRAFTDKAADLVQALAVVEARGTGTFIHINLTVRSFKTCRDKDRVINTVELCVYS